MNTVLVTGYAKAPQGTAMSEAYQHAGCVLEINFEKDIIVNAEFTFIADLSKDFFKRLLIGSDLSNGTEYIEKQIEKHFIGPSSNSVIVALKAAYRRYKQYKDEL